MPTPAMAALMPPRELAKRWKDFLPLLGKNKRPVFLALGGDDAARKQLWLATPECQYLRDEPTALAFVLYPDSLWVDVPAAFTAPPPAEEGAPAPAGGAPGLWEELVRFLPKLPGRVAGVAVFIDAAEDPEAAASRSRWTAGKLDRLFAGRRKKAPAIWTVSTGLEQFPGGARLLEKTGIAAEPLGAISPDGRTTISPAAFAICLAALEQNITGCIRSRDAAAAAEHAASLSPELHLLRRALPALTQNAKTFCEAAARGARAKAAPFGGLFLCGVPPHGSGARALAFGAAIPRSVLPGQARRAARAKSAGTLFAATALILLAALAALGLSYSRARAYIGAMPTPPPAGTGAPPVERYARMNAELNRLEHSHAVTRALYAAPNRALDAAREQFAAALARDLPAPADPARTDAWVAALAEWTEGQGAAAPLPFAMLSGRQLARMRGAHTKAGRTTTANLLSAFRARLNDPKIDALQKACDARLRADWRQNGEAILAATLASAEADDFTTTRDFLNSDPAAAFVRTAGEELDFPGAESSDWSLAAVTAARAMREAAPDNADAPAAKRLPAYRESLAALHPRSRDETSLADLAAEAYAPPGGNPPPPSLADAAAAWSALDAALQEESPSFAAPEGRTVAALLRSHETLLRRAALRRAAVRVQSEWDELVRLPLDIPDADAAVLLLLDEKPHRAFTDGFAKHFLAAGDTGRRPARALGEDFPFTEEALEWLNRAETLAAGLDEEYPVRLAILPVTTDRTARIFPRGLRFTQNGAPAPVTATSYNNRAETAFTWSARTGADTGLSIFFDAFTLHKTYPGRLGFLHFLRSLKSGALTLPAAGFPDQRRELERNGVRAVHAHFELTDPKNAAALDAALSPPPPRATR